MVASICKSLCDFICLPCHAARGKFGKKTACILYIPVIGHAAYLLENIARCFRNCCCKPQTKYVAPLDPMALELRRRYLRQSRGPRDQVMQ